MALTVDCCLVISFFGVIFYCSMGFLIIGQPLFLRFKPEDRTASIISSFITAVIFIGFMILMVILRRREKSQNVQRENYVAFNQDKERTYSETKGIPMTEFRKLREQ